ncbi:MAG TPA: hypothetical protein VGO61_20190 [Steroidobacteraceae bacterium]|jgi:hypothetical protein|nr:hypothetical protein [Steroidobacteraceae bacterium]
MNLIAIHHGASTTVVKIDGFSQASWRRWQSALVSAIARLNEQPNFEVTVPTDADFISGVSCTFQGKAFSFVSDVPGEVIIVFGTLRPRFSEQLVAEITESWASVAV